MAVDVAVGEQSDEVQRLARLADAQGELLPDLAAEQATVGDRGVHELGALVEDAARAERVVPHLAVAHVVVARQADRLAVRAQGGARAGHPQAIEGRRRGDARRLREC